MHALKISYKRHRFPPQIFAHVVWLYVRFNLSLREVASGLDHWSRKGLNNRAENSHLPFRKRERVMQGFRSPGGLQRFVPMQSATRNCFSVLARGRSALTLRYHRLKAFEAWKSAANIA